MGNINFCGFDVFLRALVTQNRRYSCISAFFKDLVSVTCQPFTQYIGYRLLYIGDVISVLRSRDVIGHVTIRLSIDVI